MYPFNYRKIEVVTYPYLRLFFEGVVLKRPVGNFFEGAEFSMAYIDLNSSTLRLYSKSGMETWDFTVDVRINSMVENCVNGVLVKGNHVKLYNNRY